MIAPAALPVFFATPVVAVAGKALASAMETPAPQDVFAGLLQELGVAVAPIDTAPPAAVVTKPQVPPQTPEQLPSQLASQDATPAEPAGAATEPPTASVSAIPVTDSRCVPLRQTSQTTPPARTAIKSATAPQIPFVAMPVELRLPLPVLLYKVAGGASGDSSDRGGRKAVAAGVSQLPEVTTLDDTALEIRIRTNAATDVPVKPAVAPSVGAAPQSSAPETQPPVPAKPVSTPAPRTIPETSHLAPESPQQAAPVGLPPQPAPAQAAAVHAVTAPVPTHSPEVAMPKPPEPPARASNIEEPIERPSVPAQPVRSLSLEFTPDGAGDVRLRLSERTGEVHISLHSSDTNLGSRLHEGVHDLVGSLSSAGYEAEAWTPGQSQQQNRREQEQREDRRSASPEPGDSNFADLFQQPVQEIS